ncbi:MAG: nucleotidyl transferase AbiEii/AbiGii toxin family protein [Proteobacteria bacterium]|nr:nucleotidyl transferase AbiEii/AbiGii toxin family protein [Pseudomonadota bacterium]
MAFDPRLDALPPAQRDFWPRLTAVPPSFILYGGTAIALHLGHRTSVDFDFFSPQGFDPDGLLRSIDFLRDATVDQLAANTLTVTVHHHGPIKVSFFGLPGVNLGAPLVTSDIGLRVAALIDLAGMKAAVLPQGSEAKDYLDLAAILDHGGISLPMALSAASAIYGRQYNPQLTLKALTYYGDGNLHEVPQSIQRRLVEAATAVDLNSLPTVRPSRSVDPPGSSTR